MPTGNAAQFERCAPASPSCENANFRTNIGDFPHQLPPKTFQGQVVPLRARIPKSNHDGAHRLGG